MNVRLTTLPAHECPYLPNRLATNRAFYVHELSADVYHRFMDAGFRRSGKLIYQPICTGCRACLPIRVDVQRFAPTKSQRRCLRRNADLIVTLSEPISTDEKFDLYSRYVTCWHESADQKQPHDRESFEAFLYDSPTESIEFSYRDISGKLLAVGICDQTTRALSSVYFYFDPERARRGLGTFGALYELAWAHQAGLVYYYLGYWVMGCQTMEYKANFHPHQILMPTGQWCDEPANL